VVGIKGAILYGAMAAGPVGAPWKLSNVGPNVGDDVDAALADGR
jgi:hypothetical protein